MKYTISVNELSKTYTSPVRDIWWRQLLRPQKTVREALKKISFTVKKGEFIGLVGPNGAGKTTLLKILTGILYPDTGSLSVLGYIPFKKEEGYLKRISFVMGQRYQLMWELPALDSYELHRLMYEIPQPQFTETLKELCEMLDANDLVKKPVKMLSLGQRMRVELIGSLLHRPEVLFMDEPTLGLDVVAQNNIIRFLNDYRRRYEPSILFTSHYMRDVERLADRVLLISAGSIVYDGPLPALVAKVSKKRMITVTLNTPLSARDEQYARGTLHATYSYPLLTLPAHHVQEVLPWVLRTCHYDDIDIGHEPIEVTIERLFRSLKPL